MKGEYMKNNWWKETVVYQIYPRSFQDSNGDGIGDLQGIISRLDYLEKLGVGVIWLCPVYESPNDDNGYDISNYKKIMPEFGTMEDMERLIREADKRQIKIMMDLVLNHTSDEHPWFKEAKKSKSNPYRDYYIWEDSKDGQVPNDLQSTFSGPAWEFHEETNQYYLHLFSKKQPDLNWANPQVRKELYQIINFWLEKGVGGFRFDVIDLIGKVPEKLITSNGPRLHEYLQEMNQATFGKRNIITVGETWGATPEIAKLYSNPKRQELSMVFQFETENIDRSENQEKWDSDEVNFGKLKSILAKWQTELGNAGWNALFWSNHDLPRVISRLGDEINYPQESGSALAILLYFLKGTPFIYQGEEIGMTNRYVKDISQIEDIESLNMAKERLEKGYSKESILKSINKKGRDTARSPMQWDNSKHAGFTKGQPWLFITQDYEKTNVKEALKNKDSLFYIYQKLIALRKEYSVILQGNFKLLPTEDNIFAYIREDQDEKILVVVNLTKNEASFDLPEYQKLLIHNYSDKLNFGKMVLKPYQSLACLL